MIYYAIAWDSDKNLGEGYNRIMASLPNDNDWACIIDADACFTTINFGKQIEDIIKKVPKADCFTCYTNRVGRHWQIAPGVDKKSNDIEYHRAFGKKMQEKHYGEVGRRIKANVLSGVFMAIKKKTWLDVGGFKKEGILGVDNNFHRRLKKYNKSLFLMKGVYVYHWYRNGSKDTSHLK